MFSLLPKLVFAHCPLCTAGAGIGAILAKEIGFSSSAIGVFIGAFSVALGWWLANSLRKRIHFRFLTSASVLLSFFTIFLPLRSYFYETNSFYLNLFGHYGSHLNRTYVYDSFLLGGILGALLIFLAPIISRQVTKVIGRTLPFQGLLITFLLLIISALLLQWLSV